MARPARTMVYTRLMPVTSLLLLVPLLLGKGTAARDLRTTQVHDASVAYFSQGKVPGFSVAIFDKGKLAYSEGFGYADMERNVAANPNTLFRLGSVSKPLTAMAVMHLVEEGKVNLEDDIRKYVPSFPDKGQKITVRQILCHQSGIRHYVEGRADGGKHYLSCADAIEIFANDPLLFAPGEKYSYSTHAYTLLGALIESVTQAPYDNELNYVLRRPAMIATPRVEDRSISEANRSQCYGMNNQQRFVRLRPDDLTWKIPGGGTEATAVDLANLGSAILDGRILSDTTVQKMWTAQKTNDGKYTNYGLGWGLGRGVVSHSGSQLGAESIWILFPRQKVVVVVLSNLQHNPIEELGNQIAKIWTQAQ